MIKLSRTAWNNVIIFSVMGMILLLNITNKKLFPEGENPAAGAEKTILGEHAVILTLRIDHLLTVERVGKSWRSEPVNDNDQLLEQMMLAWQQSAGYVLDAPAQIYSTNVINVTIGLAGENQEIALRLYPMNDQLLLHNITQNVWLSLPIVLYQQLFPSALLTREENE